MYVLSAITLMVWIVPYLFSKDEQIEDVFEVSYLQVDSAENLLLSRSQSFNQGEPKRIFIAEGRRIGDSLVDGKTAFSNKPTYPYKKKQPQTIDINRADSMQFEQLPAIGIKLSSRIVRYRDRLGGFLQLAQLKEVYGISDSAYQVMLPFLTVTSGYTPQKIPINKADYAMLRKHPYAEHEFIKMVLAYRKSHGPFKGKEDLEKIMQLDLNILGKILPYLSFEN